MGPNIALALATALGDTELIWKSLKTGAAGFVVALSLSILIGKLWHLNFDSRELLARTDVGLDSVALALASGAAAVLSLSTRLPSVLVGVMVAVALLPPTATMGLMLGAGKFKLAVNVVSVNLSAKVTFLVRGIKPRTWLEKQKARQSMTVYIVFWVAAGDPDGGDLSAPSNPSLIPGRLSAQRAHRKPVNAIRSSGSASVRSAGRMPTEKLIHEPPRITFLEPSPGPGGL